MVLQVLNMTDLHHILKATSTVPTWITLRLPIEDVFNLLLHHISLTTTPIIVSDLIMDIE